VFVLLVLALVGGVTVGLIRGGTPDALARIYVARPWTFAVMLGALVVGRLIPGTHAVGWVTATVTIALFAAANSRLPGVGLLLAGITLNTLVVLANGGQMPVSRSGAESAGVQVSEIERSSQYTPGGAGTVLQPATDVIPLAFPNAPAVVSIGDVLIASGVGLFGAVAPVRARRTLEARRARMPQPPYAGGGAAPDPLSGAPRTPSGAGRSDPLSGAPR
jgi:hypothetical protein